jgi:hypothetical protein
LYKLDLLSLHTYLYDDNIKNRGNILAHV